MGGWCGEIRLKVSHLPIKLKLKLSLAISANNTKINYMYLAVNDTENADNNQINYTDNYRQWLSQQS